MQGILEQYAFYRQSSESVRSRMLARSLLLQAPEGSELFGRACRCHQVLLVGAGDIRVFTLSAVGRELTLYHVARGETCPINIVSVLLGKPTPAYAKVDTALTAVAIPAADFRCMVAQEHAVRDFAFAALADRLDTVIGLVEQVTFRTLEQRLVDFLCEQFHQARDISTRPQLVLTHDQIAAELGSAREVISRLLRQLENRGAICLGRGKIGLSDYNLLKNKDKKSPSKEILGNISQLRDISH